MSPGITSFNNCIQSAKSGIPLYIIPSGMFSWAVGILLRLYGLRGFRIGVLHESSHSGSRLPRASRPLEGFDLQPRQPQPRKSWLAQPYHFSRAYRAVNGGQVFRDSGQTSNVQQSPYERVMLRSMRAMSSSYMTTWLHHIMCRQILLLDMTAQAW